jgi:hypothetical protein
LVVYNRIPKTGSTSLRTLFEELQFQKDFYLITSTDWLSWHRFVDAELEAWQQSVCEQLQGNRRVLYDQHVRLSLPRCGPEKVLA